MTETVHNEHDKTYKDIFSNKEYFAKLLRNFVKEDWVKDIDEDSLQYINKSYVMPDFIGKEADVVYSLSLNGKNIIFYCLLELQSTPDHSMPIRLLYYMTAIWTEILKNLKKEDIIKTTFRLPAIVPIVLFNGGGGWHIKRHFKEMLDGYELFSDHIIDFSYIFLDVKEYSGEELLKLANIVSTVFYLDAKVPADVLVERIKSVAEILKKLDEKELRLLKRWIRFIFRPRLKEEAQATLDKVLDENSNVEVDLMISNLAKTLDELIEESIEKGIEETAINALNAGADVDFVAKITKLPVEKVIELKNNIESEK